jgi:cytochrome c oxidase subunit 2
MTRRHLAVAVPPVVTALALAVDPVAAQSSATSGLIERLNYQLLVLAIPITLLVEGILLYTVYRFRNADEAKPTRENRRLEITWTVATAIILLFVGVASYGVLANENVTYQPADGETIPDDAVVVQADAYQWNWNMSYPREGLSEVTGADTELTDASGPVLIVPANTDLYIQVTAQEVLHALHVPQMGLKQDAIPGQTNTIKTVPYETGEYQGYCAEYCGVGHSNMYFTVVVVSEDDYRQFIETQTGGGSQADLDASAADAAA